MFNLKVMYFKKKFKSYNRELFIYNFRWLRKLYKCKNVYNFIVRKNNHIFIHIYFDTIIMQTKINRYAVNFCDTILWITY